MKYQMMIKILFLLLSRKKVSAKYIADRFDISIRTVYRYIDELCLANVPIYNERGRNGGYSISENYKIPSTYLNAEESEQIISALIEINKELGSDVIGGAIEKLGSISKNAEGIPTINFGNLVIDGSAWGVSDAYGETLKILQKAIEEKALLSISYVDRDGITSEREIEPHVLALKQGLWYVYAYCRLRNTFRLFKVGRIQKIKSLNETFARREILDVKAVFEKWYDEPDEDIDLVLDKSVKPNVEEWLGVDKVHVSPSGKITASVRLPIDDYLTAKILSFGNKIKVESPKKLKDAVIKTAKSVEDLYR